MPARVPLRPDDVLELDPAVELFVREEGVIGLGPTGLFALDDVDEEGLRATIAAVDGVRTVAQIRRELIRFDAGDVMELLAQLEGVVLRRAPRRAQAPGGAASPVVVVGSGVVAARVVAEIERTGRSTINAWPDTAELALRLASGSMAVCALEGARGRDVLDVAEACRVAKIPVLFVAIERGACRVGPLWIPGRTACFACSRLSTAFRDVFDTSGPALVAQLSMSAAPVDAPASWLERIAFEVARECERIAPDGAHPARMGSLLVLSPSGETRIEPIHAVTTCPACGGGSRHAKLDATARPPLLAPRVPAPVRDRTGGSRTVTPDEAERRALAAFERLGAVAACIPLDAAAPEALAAFDCPFFALEVTHRFRPAAPALFPSPKGPCYGKGTTVQQARCSAYFEWFERNLADFRGDRDLIRAPWSRVRDHAIDMPFYVSGFLPGLALPGRRPFDPESPIDWVWGRCLRRERPILVPATSVFLCGTRFLGSALELPGAGSSGLSAGCSFGDAVLQGLLEIVERDATFTAIRNGSVHDAIAVESIDEPASRGLLARMRAAGYEPHVRDITSSVGIPTIEVYLVRDGEYGNHFAMGYGAHLDAGTAMRRAVTEAAQTLLGGAAIGAADVVRADSSFFERFAHRQQALEKKGALRHFEASPPSAASRDASVWEQIDEVTLRIERAIPGADVCAVDLSTPDLPGIHVVRTLVTGMLDEARSVQLHIPERCRLVPLGEMYLGPLAM